jgi:hypothetical protein
VSREKKRIADDCVSFTGHLTGDRPCLTSFFMPLPVNKRPASKVCLGATGGTDWDLFLRDKQVETITGIVIVRGFLRLVIVGVVR